MRKLGNDDNFCITNHFQISAELKMFKVLYVSCLIQLNMVGILSESFVYKVYTNLIYSS